LTRIIQKATTRIKKKSYDNLHHYHHYRKYLSNVRDFEQYRQNPILNYNLLFDRYGELIPFGAATFQMGLLWRMVGVNAWNKYATKFNLEAVGMKGQVAPDTITSFQKYFSLLKDWINKPKAIPPKIFRVYAGLNLLNIGIHLVVFFANNNTNIIGRKYCVDQKNNAMQSSINLVTQSTNKPP